jgi:hypothetical protein
MRRQIHTASELLPCLDEDTGESTKSDLVLVPPEAVGVRALAESQLLLEVLLDLSELALDVRVVGGETNETTQSGSGIGVAPTLDEPSRGFWEENHAASEDTSPDKLDGDGDAVGGCSRLVLGSVVDDGGEEDTDGDCPLVCGDNSATNPLGRAADED